MRRSVKSLMALAMAASMAVLSGCGAAAAGSGVQDNTCLLYTSIGIDAVGKLDIRPADSQLPVGNLSGGNQQKVVIGKWLARDLRVLLIDEPTAGIDIGAKDEIYKILDNLAEQGVSILLVS